MMEKYNSTIRDISTGRTWNWVKLDNIARKVESIPEERKNV
jgi:hypothetical protein